MCLNLHFNRLRPKPRLEDPCRINMRIDWFEKRTRDLYSHLEDRVLIPTWSRSAYWEASEYSNSRPYRIVNGYVPLPHSIACWSQTPRLSGHIYATVAGCLLTWDQIVVAKSNVFLMMPLQINSALWKAVLSFSRYPWGSLLDQLPSPDCRKKSFFLKASIEHCRKMHHRQWCN